MRAAVPVLLLVALAGCQSVFSASLEVSSKEDTSDERVEISDLQKSEETEDEVGSEEGEMVRDNCFGKAVRDEPEQKLNPTSSSVGEEMMQGAQSTEEEKTGDEGTEARAEVRAHTLNLAEEYSDEEKERIDIEVLRHAGETDMATE